MKITLVRHGQTENNYLGIMQGKSNALMNDTGRRQCKRLRERIINNHYDYCFTSPLVRCVETSMILIGDRVEMIPDKRLIERDIGEFENMDSSLYDAKKYWDYDLNFSDKSVESIKSLFERCNDFLSYIYSNYSDKDILIVTHNGPFRALRHLLLNSDLSSDLLDGDIENCKIQDFDIKKTS